METSITIYGSVPPNSSLSKLDAELERRLHSIGEVAIRVDHQPHARNDWMMQIALELEESLTAAFGIILDILERDGITSGVRFWVLGDHFSVAEAREKLDEESPDWENISRSA